MTETLSGQPRPPAGGVDQTPRPAPLADCIEAACPCPGAPCSISLLAHESRGPHGSALSALSLLHHATALVRGHLERTILAPDELSWTGWQVLTVVGAWGSLQAYEVAAEVAISKATVTGVLATLTGRGLLDRAPFPGDRRRVVLSLTPAGQELVERLFPRIAQAEADLVEPLAAVELAALCNATRALVRQVDAVGRTAPQP